MFVWKPVRAAQQPHHTGNPPHDQSARTGRSSSLALCVAPREATGKRCWPSAHLGTRIQARIGGCHPGASLQ